MDIVFIRGLTAFAQIGVYEWEQQIKQRLELDLEMAWDFSKAAESDDVQYCLNYAEISARVLEFVESTPFALVETLAHRLVTLLQTEWGIPWVRLTVNKPRAVAQAQSVGVVVEKGTRE